MSNIDSFVFYRSYLKAMKTLSEKEQIKLFWAIANRSLGEEDIPLNGKILGMFSLIEPQITANQKKYLIGKKAGAFGKLGGRPSKQNISLRESSECIRFDDSMGFSIGIFDDEPNIGEEAKGVDNSIGLKPSGLCGGKPSGLCEGKRSKTLNVNENVNVNENNNDNANANANENTSYAEAADAEASYADTGMRATSNGVQCGFGQSGEIGHDRRDPKIDYQAITEDYNQVCKSLPAVKCLTDARRTAIKARIAEHTAEKLHEVFEKAEKSDFLCGRHRTMGWGLSGRGSPSAGQHENWRASFDWLLNKANFVKVLEGNYDNKPSFDSDQTSLDDIF